MFTALPDMFFPETQGLVYNLMDFASGNITNGTTDATSSFTNVITAIANSPAAAGTVFMPPGNLLISSPINVPLGVTIIFQGSGPHTTNVIQSTNFSGSGIFVVPDGSSYIEFRDFRISGATSTYSSNPAADGINMTGVADCFLYNLYIQSMNGYGVNSQASSTNGMRGKFTLVQTNQCASGFHIRGQNGSNNVGTHVLYWCNASATQVGDCFLIEDIHDILMVNCMGSSPNSGSSLHIKGKVSALYCTQMDMGPASAGNNPIVLIENSASGNPQNICLSNGIVESGSVGINITSGSQITITGLNIYNNGGDGILMSGTINAIVIKDNQFLQNNTGGGATVYEIECTANTGSTIFIDGNTFNTPQGTTSGHVLADIRDVNGVCTYVNNYHLGTGFTSTNYFLNGPVGGAYGVLPFPFGFNITAPTIGASPFTPTAKNGACAVYVTGGTVSSIAIGGVATGLTSGLFIVPAGQTITLTYSVAPTWTWFRLNNG